jgi:hypothetical protein
MNFRRRAASRIWFLSILWAFGMGSIACVMAQGVTANLAQKLVFSGLRSVGQKGQINALGVDAAGDVYLAYDQGDGVRILKVANDGGALLAQVQLGARGDSAVALALDPAGNVYVAGTSSSGSLTATGGAAMGSATAGTTNSFVAKFDGSLDEVFLTFTGGSRIAASAIAANADSVFVTGITYGTDLPVSATAIEPTPAFGSFQNGFVEAFSSDGTTLRYATYVTGAAGDTTPTGIAVDAGGDAWLAGSTTASGFPTIAAVVPEMLSNPSGFLLQLTPAGDGIVYSTFVPGAGLTSVALDSTGLKLLVSGQVALGQFPVDTVASPLVPTAYQVLLEMSLDGSVVERGTVIAPGGQSVVTAGLGGAAWVGGSFTPGFAPFLPQRALSTTGTGYAVRVSPGVGVDETMRFGGLANFDQAYASVPVALNGLAVDGTGALFAGGSAEPSASANLLASESYDFPLLGGPTAALPSAIADAEVPSASCGGSLCSGSAGYLSKIDATDAGPALAFSANGVPNITLRNLGSVAAQGVQLTASAGTLTTNCGAALAPGAECDLLLAGGGAGTLTASTSNGGDASVSFPAYSAGATLSGLVYEPKELDYGIQSAASAPGVGIITVSNLSNEAVTFDDGIIGTPKSSTPFTEMSSTCALAANGTQKVLAAGSGCMISVGFAAFASSSSDGSVQGEWTIGGGQVLLTGYSQAASLSVSASEVDFGTQFQGGLALPRYLYLSNASDSFQTHTAVNAATDSPFTAMDGCPGSLPPQSVCRIRIDYLSSVAPSSDATTLTLDAGLSVLVTGQTMPAQGVGGSTLTSSVTVSPASATFGNAVVVTGISTATQTVMVTNGGTTAVPLEITVSGDFSEVSSCGSTLQAATSCAVVVAFTPSKPGVRQGLLTVQSGAGNAPVTVALSGTGTGILQANNGTLSFAATPVGQPSVQYYKVTQPFNNLSVKTTGPYLATLVEDEGFGYGDPPSSVYVASGSGTCHNCWVGLRFQPTTAGAATGTLSLSSDPNGLPYVLQLTGIGNASSGLVVSPSVSDFGTVPVNSASGALLFSLTNLNDSQAAVTLSAVTASGDFTLGPSSASGATCSGTLAYGATCSVWVQFSPSAVGPRTGSLSILTSEGTASASLSGTGTADPGIAISPLSLTFANLPGQTGEAQTVTLQNTGSQSVSVGSLSTAGTAFAVTSACGSLAPGALCSVQVTYIPGSSPVTDVLSIPILNAGPGGVESTRSYQVGLLGEYSAQNSGIAITPGLLSFGPQAVGSVGSSRLITLTNLTSDQVTLSLAMPRSYTTEGTVCKTLAANARCAVTVVFAPLENGDLPGTITVNAIANGGNASSSNVAYADGFGVGSGALSITGGLIVNGVFNFGSVSAGQSISQVFQLTNNGTERITVRRLTSQPPFFATSNCGAALASASSCAVTVQYQPGSNASSSSGSEMDMGSLIVESDAQSSPDSINLEGQELAGGGSGSSSVAGFTLSESALSFAQTTVGYVSAPQSVTLTNTGTSTLQVSSATSTPDFTIQNGCGVITAGGSCTIVVSSSPQSAGTHLATLEIASNAATSLEYVTLFGTGESSSLVFSPDSLAFGSIPVGTTATLPVQVTNAGSTAITFTSITAGTNFNATGNCPTGGATLAPAASCTESITFQPTSAGAVSGDASFTTSASSNPLVVPLSGTGIVPELVATPASLSFGAIVVGASANLSITLTNQGTTALTGLSYSEIGDFSVTSPCARTTLAAGASCVAQVTFTPTTTGPLTGLLTISSSDPTSPLLVPLSGSGLANAGFTLTVNGGASATADVISGDFVTFALSVSPTGTFGGNVALTCTPVQTVAYASCALLPSQVNLGGAAQSSIATINTEQSNVGVGWLRGEPGSDSSRPLLALLFPGVLLMWRRGRKLRRWIGQGLAVTAMLFVLVLTACGGKGASSGSGQHLTPPGQYQFQVTANSTSGVVLSQTVTLNVVVTAP